MTEQLTNQNLGPMPAFLQDQPPPWPPEMEFPNWNTGTYWQWLIRGVENYSGVIEFKPGVLENNAVVSTEDVESVTIVISLENLGVLLGYDKFPTKQDVNWGTIADNVLVPLIEEVPGSVSVHDPPMIGGGNPPFLVAIKLTPDQIEQVAIGPDEEIDDSALHQNPQDQYEFHTATALADLANRYRANPTNYANLIGAHSLPQDDWTTITSLEQFQQFEDTNIKPYLEFSTTEIPNTTESITPPEQIGTESIQHAAPPPGQAVIGNDGFQGFKETIGVEPAQTTKKPEGYNLPTTPVGITGVLLLLSGLITINRIKARTHKPKFE